MSASENPMDINVGVLAHFWKLLLWKSSFCIFRVVLNWGHVILPEVLNIAVNDQTWFHSSLCRRLCNLQILFSEHETIIISIGYCFSLLMATLLIIFWESFWLLQSCFTVVNGSNHWILLLLRAPVFLFWTFNRHFIKEISFI